MKTTFCNSHYRTDSENSQKKVCKSASKEELCKDLSICQDDKTVLSLFSGCGGLDIGFEGDFTCLRKSINTLIHPDWIQDGSGDWVSVKRTGFRTIFANDIRPDAKAAWVNYFSKKNPYANIIYHLDSIVDLVKLEKEFHNVFPKNIDILTGGFPCQDFSIAGKRQGFKSETSHKGARLVQENSTEENRGQLYIWMREVINITNPKVFIAENVKGLTNLNNVKDVIESDFSHAGKNGYIVVPSRVIHAADYGVPQNRERVIFFGFNKNFLKTSAIQALTDLENNPDYDPYPIKTHNYTTQEPFLVPFVKVKDAFLDLDEPDISSDPSQKKYSKAKFMGRHCQGQTEVNYDDVAPTIRSEHHGNIEFRRLATENGGKNISGNEIHCIERRLSVRECARLQTFPDNYQFILPKTESNISVNSTNAYKIIGNAVPCLLGYNIAMRLAENWNKYFD